MRFFFLTLILTGATFSAIGCGGGAKPDVPATLSPDEEQKILDQVEGNAAGEEGKS